MDEMTLQDKLALFVSLLSLAAMHYVTANCLHPFAIDPMLAWVAGVGGLGVVIYFIVR